MRTSLFELSDHEILRRNGFRARVLIYFHFIYQAKGISPSIQGRRCTSEVLQFWIFFPLELEESESRVLWREYRMFFNHVLFLYGCSESNDSPLKQKVSIEMFAMDNAQKVESEWMCRKGSLELQQ
ncbi:hypothetical protein TNCT_406901 [Trichonephila clavata]|uniref:Uncharacterized protein n=1 Tax=Trichonephila clavata TaxID=2740835 RepID=A0A8X6GXF9_TRICU|nr:hypothetical protein TNCT_406901 [Trichonephila clavata]